MKKIAIAFTALFLAGGMVKAQDVKKVKIAYTLNKIEDAKGEIDKLASDAKFNTNADAVLLKTMIYGRIAGDAALSAKYPNATDEAFTSLKKYLQLDPEAKKIKDEGYVGLNEIYRSFFSEGVKEYNNKNWDKAFNQFKQLIEISDIMISRKWSTASFDTTGYLYAGITAQNSKKEDEAVKYYSQIADRKVKGADYQHIYVFLPSYYSTKKDEANFNKYIALGKEVYPEKTFWNDMAFEFTSNNLSLADLVKRYDEEDAAKKLTATQYFDYGNLFIGDKRVKELDGAEKSKYLQRSFTAFTKASELDPANALAAYNAGVTQYSLWEEAVDAARNIKGTTADVKAKRAAADKGVDAVADKTIEWLEKAYSKLEAKTEKEKVEVSSQKNAARFLTNLYMYRRDRSKGNDALYDKFDKKFKFYDTKF